MANQSVDLSSRRSALKYIGAAVSTIMTSTIIVGSSGSEHKWDQEWDRALNLISVTKSDANYDDDASLLRTVLRPDFNAFSHLRGMVVHDIRTSSGYARLLLEVGGADRVQRAVKVLDRVLSLQETNPKSEWYGVWSYYPEEPLSQMTSVDMNWADFIGASLLTLYHHHRGQLPKDLSSRVVNAIHHAAYSVMRRDVTLHYTNIAAQGTFVVLAAAELTGDQKLLRYAIDRIHRFAKIVDLTGSFAEYNSSNYARVTITNLISIQMFVANKEAHALNEKLLYRKWLHVARHWHAPTEQHAGPMSRCLDTDVGTQLWLQKSLGGLLEFASLDDIRAGKFKPAGATSVGILDFKCPPDLIADFTTLKSASIHREMYFPGNQIMEGVDGRPIKLTKTIRPIQGTTWKTPYLTLGTVNRGDFWEQSRPLLAYWGSPKRPARYLQLQCVKDDYGFPSALFYSVQNRGSVLAGVNFRSDGGIKPDRESYRMRSSRPLACLCNSSLTTGTKME